MNVDDENSPLLEIGISGGISFLDFVCDDDDVAFCAVKFGLFDEMNWISSSSAVERGKSR
jgi:hypothetical protein